MQPLGSAPCSRLAKERTFVDEEPDSGEPERQVVPPSEVQGHFEHQACGHLPGDMICSASAPPLDAGRYAVRRTLMIIHNL